MMYFTVTAFLCTFILNNWNQIQKIHNANTVETEVFYTFKALKCMLY